MKIHPLNRTKPLCSGFTLLEVLIALLIFSLGLLGMASLMVLSVRTNQSAYLRTQATFLAQAMMDRMRANLGEIPSYAISYPATGSDPCASGASCSPAQIAEHDIALWSTQLTDSLPGASAEIECAGGSLGTGVQVGAAPYDGLCTLTMQWSESTLERTSTATPATQTFAWVFQP
ncbi:MAG: type IV pilus modification protein PilV [Sphingomonadaceae bacterium]|jgi:type IV pilus assembly protein PilV|nr:type IV pilus modification protein PilV [Sphingomonadaceae bacterium]